MNAGNISPAVLANGNKQSNGYDSPRAGRRFAVFYFVIDLRKAKLMDGKLHNHIFLALSLTACENVFCMYFGCTYGCTYSVVVLFLCIKNVKAICL